MPRLMKAWSRACSCRDDQTREPHGQPIISPGADATWLSSEPHHVLKVGEHVALEDWLRARSACRIDLGVGADEQVRPVCLAVAVARDDLVGDEAGGGLVAPSCPKLRAA
jgi:hypothetical protein